MKNPFAFPTPCSDVGSIAGISLALCLGVVVVFGSAVLVLTASPRNRGFDPLPAVVWLDAR